MPRGVRVEGKGVSVPGKPAFVPSDERCREQGLLLVIRVHSLLRVARSYQIENQVFHKQCEMFVETLAPVFEDEPAAALVTLEHDLYLNGVRIPVKANNLRFQEGLIEEFRRRRIAGLRFENGLEVEELERFFGLFIQPDAYFGPGLLEACANLGVRRVLPAVHAWTEGPGQDEPHAPRDARFHDLPADASGTGEGGGGSESARPVTQKAYSLAIHGARSLLTTTALHDGAEGRVAKRVVQPLIDGAFSNEPIVVGLSSLGHHDEYTYAHAVNVCLVAVTMGHFLELDRKALADLGVAALLHDVGKAAVYDQIRHPLESFDEADRAAAERHPIEGARLIARSTRLNQTTMRSMRVALEHHACGPGGYPNFGGTWSPCGFSAIVAVADCFVSLQMHRSERGAQVTPYRALGMVLGPLAASFDKALLWALVQAVGFYPPGQMVELSNGDYALVLAPNPKDLGRPSVRIVVDRGGVPYTPLEAKTWKPLPETLSVKRALEAAEYPVLPGENAA